MTSPPFNAEKLYLGTDPGEINVSNLVDNASMSDEEKKTLDRLRQKLIDVSKGNQLKQEYYEAKQKVEQLDIAVPRHLRDIGVAVGWAGTTVDAIDERIDWLGWTTDDGDVGGLDEVYADQNLFVDSNMAHLDGLITGLGLVSVGVADDDLTRPIVVVESASTATLEWDYKKKRSHAGYSASTNAEGNVEWESLYLENATIVFKRNINTGELEIYNRNDHKLGRCFMTRLPNRPRPYQAEGRSEISRTVRYCTDAAVRTMLGMEVNREFYTAPQRFILNAFPADFGVTDDMTAEEKFKRGLSMAMGMMNIVPPRGDNTEGDPPQIVEMRPAPPTPYIEQVKAYSIQMSAETGLAASTFGFVTDNPTSGDAIVKSDFRTARRSGRRIGSYGAGWKEVGILCKLAMDGSVDSDFMRRLKTKFANPMMPTPAATADELQKMIAAEMLVPDSHVTYELYGRLDDRQIAQLEKDKEKFEAKQLRMAVRDAQLQAAANPQRNQPSPQERPSNQ